MRGSRGRGRGDQLSVLPPPEHLRHPANLRDVFCRRVAGRASRAQRVSVVAQAAGKYDYDLVIIGCGVGGHGAALHAVEQVRKH